MPDSDAEPVGAVDEVGIGGGQSSGGMTASGFLRDSDPKNQSTSRSTTLSMLQRSPGSVD